jgi:hypothetical protein
MDSELDAVSHYGFCIDDLYHESRTHLSLDKQCPFPREALRWERLSPFHNLAASITGMNVLRHRNFCRDRLLAKDRLPGNN